MLPTYPGISNPRIGRPERGFRAEEVDQDLKDKRNGDLGQCLAAVVRLSLQIIMSAR